MLIRACWNSVVALFKKWRPAKRRRQLFGFSAEAFEPRRLLSAFIVNSLGDSHDANPGDGIAVDANGQTTLRVAIEEANAHAGADTISLPIGSINVHGSSFTITDALTINGASGGQSVIDGSAVDQVFQLAGSGSLSLSGVSVNSARELAAAARSNLLTTNLRQADLIVAFSASPNVPISVDTKSPVRIAPLMSMSPDVILDRFPTLPVPKLAKAINTLDKLVRPDGAVIPTPDAAIDDIVNALFESESSDLILPIGAEKKSTTPMVEDRSTKPAPMPMSDNDRPADPVPDQKAPDFDPVSPFDGMMSDTENNDDERSLADPVPNDAMQAVLSGWADEAGWQAPDFWTNSLRTQVAARSNSSSKLAVMATAMLTGLTAQSWSTSPRWLRESVNVTAWQRRLARLRRRAR